MFISLSEVAGNQCRIDVSVCVWGSTLQLRNRT